MKTQTQKTEYPLIESSLAAVRRELADCEWDGRDTKALRDRVSYLSAALARGEKYDVPF